MPCLIGWSSTRQDKTRTTARQLKNVQAGQMKESAASIDHIHGPKPITPFEFGFACSIYDHGRRRNEYVRKQAISKYIPVGHISSQNAILNQSQKKKKKPTQTQQPFVQDPFSANVFFRAYTLTQLPRFQSTTRSLLRSYKKVVHAREVFSNIWSVPNFALLGDVKKVRDEIYSDLHYWND